MTAEVVVVFDLLMFPDVGRPKGPVPNYRVSVLLSLTSGRQSKTRFEICGLIKPCCPF